MADGYNGFIMLDKNDSPKAALPIENEMRWAKEYQKLHPDKPLPHITPYVFRHTCCTNMNFILLGIAEFMLAGILAAGTFALALVSKDTEEFVDKTISNRYEKHVNSAASSMWGSYEVLSGPQPNFFNSKCNKSPFPRITRMTGEKSPCSVC